MPVDLPFAGRTVMVTGAAGDIGRAAAVRLAASGARLVLADLTDDLDATAAMCSEANTAVAPTTTCFDVTEEDGVQRAFDDLAAHGIVADLLFNNAGYQGNFGNIVDYDVTDFRRVLEINVTGAFMVLKCFARALIPTGRPGAVVNSASMAHGGAPNMAAYSASKAAVIALTKTAAKDLAHRSIRVNSISPAFIGPGRMWDRQVELQARTPSRYFSDTPEEVAEQMISAVPLRRYGSLDEVAAAVQFLLSEDASYITAFDIEISGGAVSNDRWSATSRQVHSPGPVRECVGWEATAVGIYEGLPRGEVRADPDCRSRSNPRWWRHEVVRTRWRDDSDPTIELLDLHPVL